MNRSEGKSLQLVCNTLPLENSDKTKVISIKCQNSNDSNTNESEKSVLNMHFHTPANGVTNVKLSMPGIQPVIHFHFNESPKSTKHNTGEENKRINFEVLDVGNVEFNCESNSEIDLQLENRRTLRSCKKIFPDGSDFRYSLRDRGSSTPSRRKVKKKPEKSNKNKSSGEECSDLTLMSSIKLRRAVVVLTDICKTNYYKTKLSSTARQQAEETGNKLTENADCSEVEQESLNNDLSENYSGDTIYSPVDERLLEAAEIKQENLISNCYGDTTDSPVERGLLESADISPSTKGRILTELAEGCNFSEILKKFSLTCSSTPRSARRCPDVTESESFVSNKVSLELNENLDNLGKEELNLNKNNLGKNQEDGNPSDKMEGFFMSDVEEDKEKTEDSKQYCLDIGAENEESEENTEDVTDQLQDSDMKSDESLTITEVYTSSGKESMDQESLDSSDLRSIERGSSRCSVPETCEDYLNNLNKSEFDIKKGKEKMKRKHLSKSKKNKKSKDKRPRVKSTKPSHSTVSSKTVQDSNTKSKTMTEKKLKSMPADYIPLKASGPTKFGVAMLNQIEPFRQHQAKDFKNEMLLGDRIKRYSESQLRMYQLKRSLRLYERMKETVVAIVAT